MLRPGGRVVISDASGRFGVGLPVVRTHASGEARYAPTYQHRASGYLAAALPLGFRVLACVEPRRPDPLVDVRGKSISYDDEAVPAHPEPWTTPPDIWSLHRWCPEAVNAAYRDQPIAVIWHLQLG